ncbi:MAG: DUF1800 domain-containing protein [Pseudolysinimonas sp.]
MTEGSTRRALLGIGGAAAVALLAAQAAAEPAAAQPVQQAKPAVAAKSAGPMPRRPAAFRPVLAGGPSTVDESAAQAMRSAAAVTVPIGAQYTTFSAAAAAAQPVASAVFDAGTAQSHLLRRATFGARVSDVADLKKYGINGWLTRQLSPTSFSDPEGDAAWKAFPLAGASTKTILAKVDDYGWDAMLDTAYASLGKQVFSKRQLFETTVDIFANHLHVPIPGEQWANSPDYLRNVIRKYSFGKFSYMLRAAMKHPAMLNFLNNDESRKEHVNENLGRELLELHTVGIAGGYSEEDVKNSARILSGRSWEGWLEGRRTTYGQYRFNKDDHYVGPVTVLGFSHANASASGGEAVGDAYLNYLAHHPGTAHKIARKIATRFVSDSPSTDLVDRLADVYLKYDTDIRQVVKAVFLSSDFWSAIGTRMRRPLEDAVGSARVLGVTRGTKVRKALSHLFWALDESGQTPHGWLPPNGYPDVAAAWLGGGAMIQRWNMHRNFIWWGFEFSRTEAHRLVTQGTLTADAWLRKIVTKLVGVPMSEEKLAAVLAGSDLEPDVSIHAQWWKSGRAVALVLDSPYFQLR